MAIQELVKFVFFDVAINNQERGRMVFELDTKTTPKTAENFAYFCVNKPLPKSQNVMSYEGCPFHRIIPGFMVQGGDFTAKDGTGGVSKFGKKFDDENFTRKHVGPVLSMANSGRNTNGSQFFITFKDTPWLDGKHVVFGWPIFGLDVLKALEDIGTAGGNPTAPAKIVRCGACDEKGNPVV